MHDPSVNLIARTPPWSGSRTAAPVRLAACAGASWVTAVATGLPTPPSDVDTPVAPAALRTMVPGALRTHVDLGALERHAEALAALVAAGLRYGWAA